MCRLKIRKLGAVVILVCGLALAGPGYADSRRGTAGEEAPAALSRVVVMPFENMTHIHGKNRTIRGPLTRKVFVTGEVAPKAEWVMDQVLGELLPHYTGVQWLIAEAGERGSLIGDSQGVALVKALQAVGQRKHADAVLVGYIYAYRERVGGDLGAERPAWVAFELALVRVKNGGIIWRSGFSESQQALNENLLNIGKFIRRKGRWVTARTMGNQAMKEMLDSFPRFRDKTIEHTSGAD